MQIGSIKKGDLVRVDNHGEVLIALVDEGAHEDPGGRRVITLAADPPRGLTKPMRLTATAHQVKQHWGLRGRSKKSSAESVAG